MRIVVENFNGKYFRWCANSQFSCYLRGKCFLKEKNTNYCPKCKIQKFNMRKFPGGKKVYDFEDSPENCIFLVREEPLYENGC